jgi:hypothetical protein
MNWVFIQDAAINPRDILIVDFAHDELIWGDPTNMEGFEKSGLTKTVSSVSLRS